MPRILRVLLRKEFLQIGRDPLILRMLLVMPMIQLIVLANAATFEVTSSNLVVVDADRSAASDALVDRFTASGRFRIVEAGTVPSIGDAALLDGRADAVLVVPAGFARDLGRDRRATVQLVLDAVNGSQAGVTQGYANEIIAGFAADRAGRIDVTGAADGESAPRPGRPILDVRTHGWYNPELDYRRFMMPGILVQLIVMVGTLMTALNIVREKEAGTLDQLNVTPIPPAAFIAAKLLPLWLIGLIEFVVGLGIARFGFDVPIEGSPALLVGGAAVFLVGALGVGLWISTVTRTQQQALFVSFALTMVYILMSGLFTPVRAMPAWVATVAQLNPVLHFIGLVRAVMLRGAGVPDVAPQLAALVVIGTLILALAVAQYRKRTA